MNGREREVRMVPLPDAAARLRLSWEQAYRALLSGRLEGERRSGRWYVTERSVLSWLEGGREYARAMVETQTVEGVFGFTALAHSMAQFECKFTAPAVRAALEWRPPSDKQQGEVRVLPKRGSACISRSR